MEGDLSFIFLGEPGQEFFFQELSAYYEIIFSIQVVNMKHFPTARSHWCDFSFCGFPFFIMSHDWDLMCMCFGIVSLI